jgi:outer membrane protein assembly factor BamB
LISIVVASSIVAYELSLKSQNVSPSTSPNISPSVSPTVSPSTSPTVSPATSPKLLWQRPIEDFASNLAVDDGKVFALDETEGIVDCFDSQSGESLWNSSLPEGGFYVGGLVVSAGRVYAGAWDDHVVCIDEATGTFLWSFQGIYLNVPNHPYPPGGIVVKDDQVLCVNDDISAHNATTGEPLWQARLSWAGNVIGAIYTTSGVAVEGFPLSGDSFDGNSVYALRGNFSNAFFCKISTDDGTVFWSSSSVTWNGGIAEFAGCWNFLPRALAITQGQVIIENPLTSSGTPGGNLLFSLNSTTGEELWSINAGATVYNPTVYNDLFIFAAADGDLRAQNLTDGTVAWNRKVDTQNLFSSVDSTNHASASPIQIDTQNQRLFWSFAVKQPPDDYTGTLCNLDLINGNITWTKQIEAMGNYDWQFGSAYNNNKVFLTYNSALWIFNASTGNLFLSQQFDHYILPPIVLQNETFVAADLWLLAYG